MRYGQFLRLFISNDDDPAAVEPVCASTSCKLHISATTEQSSTKDTEGDWEDYEVTGLAYDFSADALVVSPTNDPKQLADFIEMMEGTDTYMYWYLATTTDTPDEKNREVDTTICHGNASMSSLQVNAQNRQNASLSVSFAGYGPLVVEP